MLESLTLDQLRLGQEAVLARTLHEEDIVLFAALSGDRNPAHLDQVFAEASPFRGVIAHGLWGGALISAVIGMKLPGPGSIYLSQDFKFIRPVRPGDIVEARVRVARLDAERGRVILDCELIANGERAICGQAEVLAPRTAQRRKVETSFEAVLIERPARFKALVERAAGRAAIAARLDEGAAATAGIARAEAAALVRHDDAAALIVTDTPRQPGRAGLILLDAPVATDLTLIVWGAPAGWAPAAQALGLDPLHPSALGPEGLKAAANGTARVLLATNAEQAQICADALDHLGGAAAVAWHDPGSDRAALVGDDPDGLEIAAGLALANLSRTPALT